MQDRLEQSIIKRYYCLSFIAFAFVATFSAVICRHPICTSEPFAVHSIRPCSNSAERLVVRNRRIKVNFARLTRNQCSTRAPTLTRADPRLSPRLSIPIRALSAVRMVSGNSAPPHPTTNYMHFIAPLRAVHGGACVRAISRYCSRSHSLFRTRVSYTAMPGMRSKSTEIPLCATRLSDTRASTHTTAAADRAGDHAGGATRSFRGLKNPHRGNNRYDSCRELRTSRFSTPFRHLTIALVSPRRSRLCFSFFLSRLFFFFFSDSSVRRSRHTQVS